MLILLADAFDAELPERLRRFAEVTEDMTRLPEAKVLLIRSKTRVTRDLLARAPRLGMVIRGGVGLDNVDLVACEERDVEVHNTPEASSVAVAEMAFAMMLQVPCHLIEAHRTMAQGCWEKKRLERTELMGKTLGLVGCGRIAQELAVRARAFGMKVLGFRQSGRPDPVIDVRADLVEVLARSDYVSLHTPLTESTQGLIDAGKLAQMKPGAVLVNTARGECVVEEDIVAALQSGHLGAYATDVWRNDPPDFESCPLLRAPRVFMAPHLGASTRENLARIGEIVVDKIQDYLRRQTRAVAA